MDCSVEINAGVYGDQVNNLHLIYLLNHFIFQGDHELKVATVTVFLVSINVQAGGRCQHDQHVRQDDTI